MKLLVNKAKLTDLWAKNYATIQYGFDFKICLQTQKVTWPFEKQAQTQLLLLCLHSRFAFQKF